MRHRFVSNSNDSSWIVSAPLLAGWCLSYTAPNRRMASAKKHKIGHVVACYPATATGDVLKVQTATTWFLDPESQEWLKRQAAMQRRQALARKFHGLVEAWNVQRGVISSITAMSMCPAYQAIIGMGKPAVSLILSQLQAEGDDPDQWFWALSSITGVDPVSPEDRGNYRKMAESWMEWGRREGYAR